jgi:peroxiredoxin Q/BCP
MLKNQKKINNNKRLPMKLLQLTALLLITILPTAAFSMSLKVGDLAPDFTLQATDGKTYTLEQFKGKQAIVIAWFPMAYTRGCTIECKSLVENGHLIKKYDVTYFMASVDPIDENRGFANKHQADFPLLSDPEKITAKAFDVLNLFGVAKRITFYIGVDGKILAIDDDVTPKSSAQDMATNLGRLGVTLR